MFVVTRSPVGPCSPTAPSGRRTSRPRAWSSAPLGACAVVDPEVVYVWGGVTPTRGAPAAIVFVGWGAPRLVGAGRGDLLNPAIVADIAFAVGSDRGAIGA